jgi:hypothetical protein
MKEIAIESQASADAGVGHKYWNAYFIPELTIILQVTALDEQDAEVAKNAYVKQQLESK